MTKRATRSKPLQAGSKTAPTPKVRPKAKPLNRSLSDAKAAKQDEFYTQYVDIQKEVEAYLEFDLHGQMTLFVEYNAGNGHRKKPKAIAVIVDHGTFG
ncbi:MAG: hypothetical protein JNG88_14705 [Phycisphaerales bacterium]|nr:hypothetical protein [Phycisphaerales bacterium]